MKKFIAGIIIGTVLTGSGAYAAGQITSRDIKNRSLKTIDFTNTTVDTTTMNGVFSGSGNVGTTENPTGWFAPDGDQLRESFQEAAILTPGADLTAESLVMEWVPGTAPPGPGQSITATVWVQNHETPLSCTISEGEDGCGSQSLTAAIPASSAAAVHLSAQGFETFQGRVRWSFVTSAVPTL